MYNTEIRVIYCNYASAWTENHWLAEVVENGERLWPDVYAKSYIGPDDARQKLLEILDGGVITQSIGEKA